MNNVSAKSNIGWFNQMMEPICVLFLISVTCGNGFYYDSDIAKCTRCPKGTHRTVYPNTDVLSSCIPCTGSDTTSSTGSPAVGNCHGV